MEKKSVASVSGGTARTGNIIMGSSDVIRWDDIMTVQGHDIQVSKAVVLGIYHKLEIACFRAHVS